MSHTAQNSTETVDHVSVAANRVYSEAEQMRAKVQTFLAQIQRLMDGGDVETEALPSLEWSNRFSVDKGAVDQDHQQLFRLFNELSRAMSEGNTKSVIASVLDRLIEYTAVHFSREEQIMASTRYPHLAAHRKEHEAFVAKALEVQKKFRESDTNILAIETMDFVKNWLIEHIQKSDQGITPYLLEKRAA
ncbi:hypothetical protein CCP1ISM_3650001 [Azospirillaceae bacterium]